MRFIRALLLIVMLCFPAFSWAATTPYNPCDHLADLYKQKSAVEYQGLVESCAPKQSAVDEVQDKMETAKKVAVVAQGVGQGVGDAAKGVGSAVSDLAKNLGVTANEFLRSPAGVLLAFVLVIKFVGSGKIIGIPFVMFMVSFWWFIVNRMTRQVEYEFIPVLWGAFNFRRIKKVTRDESDFNSGFAVLTGFAMLIICAVACVNL